MLAMFRRELFYAYLSVYLRHFLDLSVTETTLFAPLPMLLNAVFQTFCWGPLPDRRQKQRPLIIAGEILAAFGTLASLGGVGRIFGVWLGRLFYDGPGARYNGWGFDSGALFFGASVATPWSSW